MSDFDEVYTPVDRYKSQRVYLAICVIEGWTPRQFDVKSAFLYGELKEDIYKRLLHRYEKEGICWELRKCLYGFKQSAQDWYSKIFNYFISKDFQPSSFDPCGFGLIDKMVFISVYVDNITIFGPSSLFLNQTIEELKTEFETTDLGTASWLHGIHFIYDSNRVTLI